jgi:HK97 gp10 family phage protein
MARGFTINIKGLKETIAKLDREGEEIKKQIDFAIGINSEAMASEAKNRVPVDTGRLKNSITASKMKPYLYEVVAQTNYAAYVEFGTGNLFVQLPEQYWNDLASQFKATPRKRLVNLPPRPYLRPSVNRITPIMFGDIEQILDKNKVI